MVRVENIRNNKELKLNLYIGDIKIFITKNNRFKQDMKEWLLFYNNKIIADFDSIEEAEVNAFDLREACINDVISSLKQYRNYRQ